MNINMKSIKGYNVYRADTPQPWGIVSSLSFQPESVDISAILVDTLSLIPLSYLVDIHAIDFVAHHSVYLKHNCGPIKYIQKDFFNPPEKLCCVTPKHPHPFRLRDLSFDMETGKITDITISKHRLSKKNKISINKIYLKDNTIYIE